MPTTADRRVADSLRLTVYGQYRTPDPDLQLEAANLIDALLDDAARLTTERDAARRWAAVWKYEAKRERWYYRATLDLLVNRSRWVGPPRNTPAQSTYTPLPHVGDAAYVPVESRRSAFTLEPEVLHGVGV